VERWRKRLKALGMNFSLSAHGAKTIKGKASRSRSRKKEYGGVGRKRYKSKGLMEQNSEKK
jgi:hypothetical protein